VNPNYQSNLLILPKNIPKSPETIEIWCLSHCINKIEGKIELELGKERENEGNSDAQAWNNVWEVEVSLEVKWVKEEAKVDDRHYDEEKESLFVYLFVQSRHSARVRDKAS